MIKLGKRKNLFYPISLILFILLRRILELIFLPLVIEDTGTFFLPLLIFSSQFIFGLLSKYLYSEKRKKNKIAKIMHIRLIERSNIIKGNDTDTKMMFLLIFASYFNFAGVVVRKLGITAKTLKKKSFEIRLRSLHLLVAALVCCWSLKTKLYFHNIISLITILICLIISFSTEFIYNYKSKDSYSILYTSFSGFDRAFMDLIDFYLLEFDYLNPFNIIIFEGIFSFILTVIVLIVRHDIFMKDIKKLSNNKDTVALVFIFLFYFIFSGMKNIYRILTVKCFSPMTRGLSECFLDPFIFIFIFFKLRDRPENKEDSDNIWYFFAINLICTIIITFCTCIYNEFLILYKCGMEYNTHIEISRRGTLADCQEDESEPSKEKEESIELFERE